MIGKIYGRNSSLETNEKEDEDAIKRFINDIQVMVKHLGVLQIKMIKNNGKVQKADNKTGNYSNYIEIKPENKILSPVKIDNKTEKFECTVIVRYYKNGDIEYTKDFTEDIESPLKFRTEIYDYNGMEMNWSNYYTNNTHTNGNIIDKEQLSIRLSGIHKIVRSMFEVNQKILQEIYEILSEHENNSRSHFIRTTI